MYNSFWRELSGKNKPVFIYGTGNGADKILDILEHFGVTVSGIFASDGFVRNRFFRGFHVQSYGEVRDSFGDGIIVIAAFGSSLPEVMDFLTLLDGRHELYIPEVPLFCDNLIAELFDDDYYLAHKAELSETLSLFSDEESKLLFGDMIAHKLTGKMCYLGRTESPSDSILSLIDKDSVHHVIDGGAFKGDTAELFCKVFPNLRRIAAIEPDPRSYKKLCSFAGDHGDGKIIPINAMLLDTKGERVFASSGSRGSTPDAAISRSPKRMKEIQIPAVSVDSITESVLDGKTDFIKLDTEGFECECLSGAAETLMHRPALSVSLYHRTADIFKIPLYLKKYYPTGKFYLRRPKCVPEWDLTLYVTE